MQFVSTPREALIAAVNKDLMATHSKCVWPFNKRTQYLHLHPTNVSKLLVALMLHVTKELVNVIEDLKEAQMMLLKDVNSKAVTMTLVVMIMKYASPLEMVSVNVWMHVTNVNVVQMLYALLRAINPLVYAKKAAIKVTQVIQLMVVKNHLRRYAELTEIVLLVKYAESIREE